MKLFKSILMTMMVSVSLLACWQDPGPQPVIVPLDLNEGFNSIVGLNYYQTRLIFDEDDNIRIDWPEGSSTETSYWMLPTSQTTYTNLHKTGLPITLYFNIMSRRLKEILRDVAKENFVISSDIDLATLTLYLTGNTNRGYGEFNITGNYDDVVKDMYLYYKIVPALTNAAQEAATWRLCGEAHFDETKTNVLFPGNNGATPFGYNTLTKKMIQRDGKTISNGDYIIFFLYVVNENGETNVSNEYRPVINGTTPILPADCFESYGPAYMIGHIYTVQYDGTEVYRK